MTIALSIKIPTGFLPSKNKGKIFIMTEGSEDISFDDMVRHQLQLANIVLKEPYVEAFMTSVGPSPGSPASNAGRMFLNLQPRSEREYVDKLIEQLRPKLMSVPGIKAYPQNPPTIRIGRTLTK